MAGELLAKLMRLRLGLQLEDVADRCKVSVSTISRLFTTWLQLLSTEPQLLFPWPSRELVVHYTPTQFKKYPTQVCYVRIVTKIGRVVVFKVCD